MAETTNTSGFIALMGTLKQLGTEAKTTAETFKLSAASVEQSAEKIATAASSTSGMTGGKSGAGSGGDLGAQMLAELQRGIK